MPYIFTRDDANISDIFIKGFNKSLVNGELIVSDISPQAPLITVDGNKMVGSWLGIMGNLALTTPAQLFDSNLHLDSLKYRFPFGDPRQSIEKIGFDSYVENDSEFKELKSDYAIHKALLQWMSNFSAQAELKDLLSNEKQGELIPTDHLRLMQQSLENKRYDIWTFYRGHDKVMPDLEQDSNIDITHAIDLIREHNSTQLAKLINEGNAVKIQEKAIPFLCNYPTSTSDYDIAAMTLPGMAPNTPETLTDIQTLLTPSFSNQSKIACAISAQPKVFLNALSLSGDSKLVARFPNLARIAATALSTPELEATYFRLKKMDMHGDDPYSETPIKAAMDGVALELVSRPNLSQMSVEMINAEYESPSNFLDAVYDYGYGYSSTTIPSVAIFRLLNENHHVMNKLENETQKRFAEFIATSRPERVQEANMIVSKALEQSQFSRVSVMFSSNYDFVGLVHALKNPEIDPNLLNSARAKLQSSILTNADEQRRNHFDTHDQRAAAKEVGLKLSYYGGAVLSNPQTSLSFAVDLHDQIRNSTKTSEIDESLSFPTNLERLSIPLELAKNHLRMASNDEQKEKAVASFYKSYDDFLDVCRKDANDLNRLPILEVVDRRNKSNAEALVNSFSKEDTVEDKQTISTLLKKRLGPTQ